MFALLNAGEVLGRKVEAFLKRIINFLRYLGARPDRIVGLHYLLKHRSGNKGQLFVALFHAGSFGYRLLDFLLRDHPACLCLRAYVFTLDFPCARLLRY